MRYTEITSLFNLDKIDYTALKAKIKNSKKNITINLAVLEPFLKLLKAESMIVNKVDVPVNFVFNISAGHFPHVTIHLEQMGVPFNILPHISHNSRDLSIDISLEDFNKYYRTPEDILLKACVSYAGRIPDDASCSWCTAHIFQMLRKVDKLLNCNNELYKAVYQHGIYPEENTLYCEYFNVLMSKKEFTVESKAKHNTGYNQSIFSINVEARLERTLDDIKVKFEMYNQVIQLTYDEFMNADIVDMEKAIVSILKLKNVNINDIDNLKSELVLHDMLKI